MNGLNIIVTVQFCKVDGMTPPKKDRYMYAVAKRC